MTNPFSPISPSPELVRQWWAEIWHEGTPRFKLHCDEHIATRAAQWGADQELEACCEWMASKPTSERKIPELRDARRPKPPSLKEQALSELNLTADPNGAELSRTQVELIRQALEALDD